jgi:hypothetical protein
MAKSNFQGMFANVKQPTQEIPERNEIRGPGRPTGKRSNPAYRQYTALLRIDTHTRVMAKLREIDPKPDFGDFIEDLCQTWLKSKS